MRDLETVASARDSPTASRPASCSNSRLLCREWASSSESNAALSGAGIIPGIERRSHLGRALHGGGSTRGLLAPGVDVAGKAEEVPPSGRARHRPGAARRDPTFFFFCKGVGSTSVSSEGSLVHSNSFLLKLNIIFDVVSSSKLPQS